MAFLLPRADLDIMEIAVRLEAKWSLPATAIYRALEDADHGTIGDDTVHDRARYYHDTLGDEAVD